MRHEALTFQYHSHRYIEMFRALNHFCRHEIGFVSFDDLNLPQWLKAVGLLRNLAHAFGLPTLLARHPTADAVFVREFLTIPLLLASPLLLRFRRRALFVLIHNVQMAHLRSRDRFALRLLARLGFRFVALETDAGLRELGIDIHLDQLLVLPLCWPATAESPSRSRNSTRLTIGLVGRLRPEKNVLKLLERLAGLRPTMQSEMDIVVGCDSPAILAQAAALGLRCIDTTTEDAYNAALDSIDILVVNYERTRYLYRTSGVIADAAFRGLVVVCPDYPAFRTQVSTPSPVGSTFSCLDDLAIAINDAAILIPNIVAATSAFRAYRDPKELAPRLDRWLDGMPGDESTNCLPPRQ
jgi:hypothetical protein